MTALANTIANHCAACGVSENRLGGVAAAAMDATEMCPSCLDRDVRQALDNLLLDARLLRDLLERGQAVLGDDLTDYLPRLDALRAVTA